jgi:hypothetical protein
MTKKVKDEKANIIVKSKTFSLPEHSYSPSDCTGKGHLFLQAKQSTEAFPFPVLLLHKNS